MWTTRGHVWLLMEGGLVLVALFPWRGVWLSPWGCTRIGVCLVAIGWFRVRVGLASAGLGLVVIPGGRVWLSTLCRVRVWFASGRGAGKGVRWMTFCGAWVCIWLAKSGAIAGFVVGFLGMVFVVDLSPRGRVRMSWAADLTVARMKRPRLGIRTVAFTMKREERVR